jgi:hypothetical protein
MYFTLQCIVLLKLQMLFYVLNKNYSKQEITKYFIQNQNELRNYLVNF